MATSKAPAIVAIRAREPLIARLNGAWHKPALLSFTAIVLAHWSEHLAQSFQVYVLGWPIPQSRGVLGLAFPWLVSSEALHYAYALVMLIGLWIFRSGFKGRGYRWWMIAFWIQFWHHIEHALLQWQAIAGQNLLDRPTPISIAQIWIPRVELHLFYNAIVFVPMVIAMYHHMFPPAQDEARHTCTCAVHTRARAA
jgi:hypothetical protein